MISLAITSCISLITGTVPGSVLDAEQTMKRSDDLMDNDELGKRPDDRIQNEKHAREVIHHVRERTATKLKNTIPQRGSKGDRCTVDSALGEKLCCESFLRCCRVSGSKQESF